MNVDFASIWRTKYENIINRWVSWWCFVFYRFLNQGQWSEEYWKKWTMPFHVFSFPTRVKSLWGFSRFIILKFHVFVAEPSFTLWGSDCALHRQTIECCSHELALVLLFCVWIVQFCNSILYICTVYVILLIEWRYLWFWWPSRLTSKSFNQNQLATCVVFFL